jgi:hypothetical protein
MARTSLAAQGAAARRKRDSQIRSAQGGSTSRKPHPSTPTFTQGSDQRDHAPKGRVPVGQNLRASTSPRDPRKSPQAAKATGLTATQAYAQLKRDTERRLAKAKAKADAEKKMLTDAGKAARRKKHTYRG